MFYTVCKKQLSTHLCTKYKLLDGGCQEVSTINDCISDQISEKKQTQPRTSSSASFTNPTHIKKLYYPCLSARFSLQKHSAVVGSFCRDFFVSKSSLILSSYLLGCTGKRCPPFFEYLIPITSVRTRESHPPKPSFTPSRKEPL